MTNITKAAQDALDRMDALINPANKLLAIPSHSATQLTAFADMATIRASCATVSLIKASDAEASADKKQISTEPPRKSRLYGCWNEARSATYTARDGYDLSEDWSATCAKGPVRFVNIQDSSSKDCKYDLADTDAKCVGCKKSPLLSDHVPQGEIE